MIENKIIIFDTNVYLNLYQYNYKITEELLEKLKIITEQIWMPYQVKEEILRNEKKLRENAFKKYISLDSQLKNKIEDSEKEIKIILSSNKGIDTKNLYDSFTNEFKEIKSLLEEFKLKTKEEEERNKRFLENNCIKSFIDNIEFGKEPTIKQKLELYQEGEVRMKYKIPPGYEDRTKNVIDALGDFLIWKEIIESSKNAGKDIIFVSDDVKKDWVNDKKEIRDDLKLEFEEETGQKIKMLTFDKFAQELNLKLEDLIYLKLSSNSDVNDKIIKYLEEEIEYEILKDKNFEDIFEIEVRDIKIGNVKYVNIDIIETLPEQRKFYSELFIEIKGSSNIYLQGIQIAEINFKADVHTNNENKYEYRNEEIDISLEETEVQEIFVSLEKIDFYEELMCGVCGIRIGDYQYSDGGLICDSWC